MRSDNDEEDMTDADSNETNGNCDSYTNAQFSAVNGIMTTSLASLVPESRDWQVVNRPPTQEHDHDLEKIDVP